MKYYFVLLILFTAPLVVAQQPETARIREASRLRIATRSPDRASGRDANSCWPIRRFQLLMISVPSGKLRQKTGM